VSIFVIVNSLQENGIVALLHIQFDPEGAGRIATEDFLLAIDSDDFRQNPEVAKKRAALKCKVLEYGTSFITIEEFVQVVSCALFDSKPNRS